MPHIGDQRAHSPIVSFWQEGTMNRERTLKVALVLVGLLFSAGIYPMTMILWQRNQSDYGDAMMLSLYFTLGIFSGSST
jgi:hypothetical protein